MAQAVTILQGDYIQKSQPGWPDFNSGISKTTNFLSAFVSAAGIYRLRFPAPLNLPLPDARIPIAVVHDRLWSLG